MNITLRLLNNQSFQQHVSPRDTMLDICTLLLGSGPIGSGLVAPMQGNKTIFLVHAGKKIGDHVTVADLRLRDGDTMFVIGVATGGAPLNQGTTISSANPESAAPPVRQMVEISSEIDDQETKEFIEMAWQRLHTTTLEHLLQMAVHRATRPSDGLQIGGVKDTEDPFQGETLGGPAGDFAGANELLTHTLMSGVSPITLRMNSLSLALKDCMAISKFIYEKLVDWTEYAAKIIAKHIDGRICKEAIEGEGMWTQVKRLNAGISTLKPCLLLFADVTYRYTSVAPTGLPLWEKVTNAKNKGIHFEENASLYIQEMVQHADTYRIRYGVDAKIDDVKDESKRSSEAWIGNISKQAQNDFTSLKTDCSEFVEMGPTTHERTALTKELEAKFKEQAKKFYTKFLKENQEKIPTNPFAYFGWVKQIQTWEKEFNTRLMTLTTEKEEINKFVIKILREDNDMVKKAEDWIEDKKQGLPATLDKWFLDKKNVKYIDACKGVYDMNKSISFLARCGNAITDWATSKIILPKFLKETFQGKGKQPIAILHAETKLPSREAILYEGFFYMYEMTRNNIVQLYFGDNASTSAPLKKRLQQMLESPVPPECEPSQFGEGEGGEAAKMKNIHSVVPSKYPPMMAKSFVTPLRWLDEIGLALDSLLVPPFAPTSNDACKKLFPTLKMFSECLNWIFGSTAQTNAPNALRDIKYTSLGATIASRCTIVYLLRKERQLVLDSMKGKAWAPSATEVCGYLALDALLSQNSSILSPTFYADLTTLKNILMKQLVQQKWIVADPKDSTKFAISPDCF